MCWPLNTQRSSSGFSNRLVLFPHRLQAITRTALEAHNNQLKEIPTDSNEKCRTTCALIPFVAVSVECLSSGLVCFISHRLSLLISSRKIGCIREYWSQLISFLIERLIPVLFQIISILGVGLGGLLTVAGIVQLKNLGTTFVLSILFEHM